MDAIQAQAQLHLQILIGNEPRAYREVIAGALGALRPTAAISLIEPSLLEAALAECQPALVLCSRLTAAIQTRARAWVLLYPDGDGRAVAGFAGQERDIPGIDFEALLAIVDQALGAAPAP